MSKELEFLEEKYGHNSWKHYPPSKQQVAQWLQEWNEKQFAICGVGVSNRQELTYLEDKYEVVWLINSTYQVERNGQAIYQDTETGCNEYLKGLLGY